MEQLPELVILDGQGRYDPIPLLTHPVLSLRRPMFARRECEPYRDEQGNDIEVERPYGNLMSDEEFEQWQEAYKTNISTWNWTVRNPPPLRNIAEAIVTPEEPPSLKSLLPIQECIEPQWFRQHKLNVGNVMMVLVEADPQRFEITTFGRQWHNPAKIRVAMYNPHNTEVLCNLCVVKVGREETRLDWQHPSPDKLNIFYNYMESEATRLGVLNSVNQEPAPYLLWKDVVDIESDLLADEIPFRPCWERFMGFVPRPWRMRSRYVQRRRHADQVT